MYATYKQVKLAETSQLVGTGWLPPLPDLRDYTEKKPEIAHMAKKLKLPKGKELKALPEKVDLRKWCSPVENQKNLGACTAHAAAGIIEYFEKKANNKYIDASRLFIYKTTRNLMQVTGDTGAWLRNTMGAMVLCGVPDEKYWPYTDANPDFDKEPGSFVYAIADNYEALKYFCHDPQGENVAGGDVLLSVKKYLAAGIPSMFGFWGFSSFDSCDVVGGIPFPCPGEQAQWGHAIVAIGYDDSKKLKNTRCNKTTTGAFLIRNSWGTTWGEQGYGWVPYEYVNNKLATDFWSLLSMAWVDTGQFGI